MSLFYNTMSLGDINYKRQGKKIKIKREESIKKIDVVYNKRKSKSLFK